MTASRASKAIGRLHVITDTVIQDRFTHADLARLAAEGGAEIVQFREKHPQTTRALVEIARAMQAALAGSGTRLLINDRVDVAAAVDAWAVHLGRDDLDPAIARHLLGPEALIGGTANSLAEARAVAAGPVDYLGVGPVFGTTTKANPAPTLGLDGLAAIVAAVDKPVIAIGSITPDRARDVLATGAHGIAVVSAVVAAGDPRAVTRAFRDAIDAFMASQEPIHG